VLPLHEHRAEDSALCFVALLTRHRIKQRRQISTEICRLIRCQVLPLYHSVTAPSVGMGLGDTSRGRVPLPQLSVRSTSSPTVACLDPVGEAGEVTDCFG
jgi:hypothetical protein